MPKTLSFVTEIPLKITTNQDQILLKRFEAARQVYNACLGESLRRLRLMRQSKAWNAARKMKKGKERTKVFREIDATFGFREYDLHSYATQFTGTWLNDYLDSQTVRKLAKRAIETTQQYAFGQRGRPRFKRYNTLNSVESTSNNQGIRWLDNQVVWRTKRGGALLKLDAIIDPDNPIIMHGLACRAKYVRLVKRTLSGHNRFYAQLVCEGKPYKRFELGEGVVGIDIGPSTLAVVSEDEAFLDMFCREMKSKQDVITKLQRKIARQRRLNNPDNYEPDKWVLKPRRKNAVLKKGKAIKGRRIWIVSERQRQNEVRLSEIQRKQAEHRKSLHGRLINRIIQMGDTINLEKLSYKAFQRLFGKSVGMRAPGMFVSRLKQKMNDYDGLVNEFSTFTTRFSQLDHKTGELRKKPLSQRWHIFDDGKKVQRDLYSAFLAICLEDGKFNAAIANEQWTGVGPLLRAALDDLQTDEWEDVKTPSSFGLERIVQKQRRLPVS